MVALLHDPKLLILDEPTVGVDPVLSASIWQHLLNISNSGKKTVIITTHYIEEARQAHCVSGFPSYERPLSNQLCIMQCLLH